ncbi:MAG: sodium:proton antiporter [Anaerolineae bacterium]|nr:sodium:proton antiporter [Anaerolineae bacterium]
MHLSAEISIVSIIVLGIAAQWVAWRLRLPSILVLLLTGLAVGPLTGLLEPDAMFGELLFPGVSVAVAVILFEGGLALKFTELSGRTGHAIRNLVSIGALVTWILSCLTAYFVLGFDSGLSIQLGAILVVTGPTVIGPLLRFIRPSVKIASILRWEGILIDPIGATLSVLVFEVIHATDVVEDVSVVFQGILFTIVFGGILGYLGAQIIIQILRRHWAPDHLDSPITLMIVVAVFAISNLLQEESGLLAVTVMGIVLANQRQVVLRHILEFKENLIVLLISSLFIILAARVPGESLRSLGVEGLIFLAVMILLVRPASVFVATIGSGLSVREKVLLSWIAPRGIVAAAVTSVFSLRLMEAGHTGAEQLVPIVFGIIVGTTAIYGLTALPLARWLKLTQENPQGVLIIGAHAWAREIGQTLRKMGFHVQLIDTNFASVAEARMMGLPAYFGNALIDETQIDISLSNLGRSLSLTPNDEVNTLASIHYAEIFGRDETYQLALSGGRQPSGLVRELQGHLLFRPEANFAFMEEKFNAGAEIKATKLTSTYTIQDYHNTYRDRALPLFLVDEQAQTLHIVTANQPIKPQAGQTMISLIQSE